MVVFGGLLAVLLCVSNCGNSVESPVADVYQVSLPKKYAI